MFAGAFTMSMVFFEFFCEISNYRQMGGGVISGMSVVIFTTWYDSFVLIRKSFP